MKKMKIFMIVLLTVLLLGCNSNTEVGDYDVAVIESTTQTENSLITYYDDNLEVVATKSLKYAGVGTSWHNPAYYEDEMYLTLSGLTKIGNEKRVLGINLKTGKDTVYKTTKNNISCTAVNKKYIFIGTYDNLIRRDFKDGSEVNIPFKGGQLSLVVASDDDVYAFITSIDEQNKHSKICIYDANSLVLKKSIDISEYGSDQLKYHLSKNKLYFSNSSDKNGKPTNKLGILDTNNLTISQVELKHDNPDDIEMLNDGKLLISCSDYFTSDGTYVIIYDINTSKQTSYDLKVPIMDIQVKKDKLYVLSKDNKLYVYDIENDMKLLKSIQHELTKGIYCGNIFVNE